MKNFLKPVYKQVNLFIAGVGNVGSRLLAQLKQQLNYLQEHLRLQIRVIGLANSSKMLFSDEGIDLSKWKSLMEEGEQMELQSFVKGILDRNLRNSVFVDVTANEDVAKVYEALLVKSISVVACNKVACIFRI